MNNVWASLPNPRKFLGNTVLHESRSHLKCRRNGAVKQFKATSKQRCNPKFEQTTKFLLVQYLCNIQYNASENKNLFLEVQVSKGQK